MATENRYPDNIMKRLRERQGLEPDDTSKDNELNTYSPREAFEECCDWEGFIGWSETLLGWVEDCFNIEL